MNLVFRAFRPEMEWLQDEKTRAIALYREVHGGRDPFEDRAVQILSRVEIHFESRGNSTPPGTVHAAGSRPPARDRAPTLDAFASADALTPLLAVARSAARGFALQACAVPGEWYWIWPLLTLPQLCFAFSGAGRVLGLDRYLAGPLARRAAAGAGVGAVAPPSRLRRVRQRSRGATRPAA